MKQKQSFACIFQDKLMKAMLHYNARRPTEVVSQRGFDSICGRPEHQRGAFFFLFIPASSSLHAEDTLWSPMISAICTLSTVSSSLFSSFIIHPSAVTLGLIFLSVSFTSVSFPMLLLLQPHLFPTKHSTLQRLLDSTCREAFAVTDLLFQVLQSLL